MAMEAVVQFDYVKQQEDELTLKAGDIVVDVVEVDEGWCEGTLNGIRGMFPDNFVKLRAVEVQPPPPAISVPTKDVVSAKKRRARVTFSYNAENPDELSLEPGQIVDVLEEEEEGWLRGSLHGKEGVFPNNFVEIVAEEEPQLPPKPAEKTRPPSMVAMPGLGGVNPLELKNKLKPVVPKPVVPVPPSETSHKPSPQPESTRPRLPSVNSHKSIQPPEPTRARSLLSRQPLKAKITYDYVASQPDEISVDDGDIVEIVSKDTGQDGWWLIRKGTNEGLIPDNFMLMIVDKPLPDPVDNPPLPPKKVEPPKPNPPLPGGRSVLPKLPDKIDQTSDKGDPPPPLPPQDNVTPTGTDELNVPHSGILDTKNLRQRPKKNFTKPPSKSNVAEDDVRTSPETPLKNTDNISTGTATGSGDGGSGGVNMAPWQQETRNRKQSKPTVPLPQTSSPVPPSSTTPNKPTVTPSTRPKPAKAGKPVPSKPAGGKSASNIISPSPSPKPAVVDTASKTTDIVDQPLSTGEWKEAFENLKIEFEKFKEELKKDMLILTKDLDNERKKNAQLSIDVDRLMKTAGYRDV